MHRDHWTKGSGVLALSFLLTSSVLAQEESELRKEIEELKRGQKELQLQIQLMQEVEDLKKGQEEIRKELADIKRLLQQQASAPARAAAGVNVRNLVLDVASNPVRGENTAPLTLVEFTDYQ
ncbi:MAG: hypothetical protein L0191_20870 [Acidobacteria bacterium]|nr:hypothetical protein [Acidobacteriota bacterium]